MLMVYVLVFAGCHSSHRLPQQRLRSVKDSRLDSLTQFSYLMLDYEKSALATWR